MNTMLTRTTVMSILHSHTWHAYGWHCAFCNVHISTPLMLMKFWFGLVPGRLVAVKKHHRGPATLWGLFRFCAKCIYNDSWRSSQYRKVQLELSSWWWTGFPHYGTRELAQFLDLGIANSRHDGSCHCSLWYNDLWYRLLWNVANKTLCCQNHCVVQSAGRGVFPTLQSGLVASPRRKACTTNVQAALMRSEDYKLWQFCSTPMRLGLSMLLEARVFMIVRLFFPPYLHCVHIGRNLS
jgi:hypothetical protein